MSTGTWMGIAGFLALLLAMAAGGLWARKWHVPQALREVARNCGGRIVPGGGWRYPVAEIKHDGLLCRVTNTPNGLYLPGHTRVRLNLACPMRLRISPEGVLWKVRKVLGAQDIQSGDPDFDAQFVIQSDSSDWARRILTREVRARILHLGGIEPVTLDLGPAGIAFGTVFAFQDESDRLTIFTRLALSMGVEIRGIIYPPMVMMEMTTVPTGHCLVCGTPVMEGGCTCRRCGTIHHLDCWSYFGGCALFACAGRPRRFRGRTRNRDVA